MKVKSGTSELASSALGVLLFLLQLATNILVVWLLLAGWSRLERTPSRFKFEGEEIQIPMQLDSVGRPTVKVRVNGKGPYLFALDSGSGAIAVSKKVIREASLSANEKTGHVKDAAGRLFAVRVHRLDVMELGTARLQRAVAYHLGSPGIVRDVDGILGLSYFTGYRVRLDFAGQVLTFSKRRVEDENADPGLPMEVKRRRPYVPLRIGNESRLFLLDTGNNGGLLIPKSVVTKLPCCPERYGVFSSAVASEKRDLMGITRLRRNLQIGPHTIIQPYICWHDRAAGSSPGVGMEILRHFTLEFDYAEKRVRFLRDATHPVYNPDRRSLPVEWSFNKNETRTVTHVFPPAFQRAGQFKPCSKRGCDHGLGVCPGDEILMIQGKPTRRITRAAIKALALEHDQLQFVVRRKGRLYTNDVPFLEDQFSCMYFGSVKVGDRSAAKKFPVNNRGTNNLAGLIVTKDGSHPADFTVDALGTNTLAAGTGITLTVTFSPTTVGVRSATIRLAKDEGAENLVEVTVTGAGVLPDSLPVLSSDKSPAPP